MSYKAKRIVIAVAATVALFTAASVGTYFYIKGNESAQATENTEQAVNENNENTTDTQNNNPQPTTSDQNIDQTTRNQDENVANAGTTPTQEPTTVNPAPRTTTTTTNADGTTTRTTRNADGTTTTIRMNNDGTTTTTITNPDGTITSQSTDANVVTETEESERLVSKDDWVGWSPEAVPVPIMARIANELGINKYKINVEKEVISTDANEDGKYDLNETITYQVKVSNIGNTILTGIKVSDKINDRENIKSMLLIDENNTLIKKIDDISEYTFDLEAGETAYFEYSYTVKEEDILKGVVQNSATATNNKVEEKTTITTDTEEVNKDYTVEKKADKKEVKAGDTVTYTITVKNTGNVTLNDVKVDDDMINLHKVVNGLAPNAETSFTGTYEVTQKDIDDQKVITNTVTVGDKTATEDITPEKEKPGLTVLKDADKKENVKAEDTVTYTITVTNTGNVTLTNISVEDTLKKLDKEGKELSTELLDIYEDKNCTTKITSIDKLEVEGENNVSSKTLYAKYKVTQEDIDNQVKLSNTATANNTPSDPAETEVEDARPGYNIEKTAALENTSKDKAEVGDSIKYIITVENTGNVTLHDIIVTDTTMNKSTTVESLNVNSGKVVAMEFTHIVEESDFKEVNGNFVVQNIVIAECTDPTDDTKKITDEAEAEVPVKDKYSYVVNYLEKDTNNVLANQKVVSDQTFGTTVTENAIDIDGYEKVDPTSAEIEITTGKNEHTFYYTKRTDLSYTVYYKEQGTENTLADPKEVGGQTFGDKVTEEAINIDGYNKVDPTSAEIEITTGTNEHTFYYTKRTDLSYTVNYLEKGTNTVLKDAKTVSNKTFGEVINSADEVIETINKDNKDYEYDSADKATLTIGTGANVINLYYVKAKDLELTKSAPATANITDTITYTITITNPNSKTKKTTLTDALPDGITILNVDETTGKLPDGKGILTEEQIENEDGTTETIRKITWTDLEVATGDTQITFNAIVDSDMIGKEITNTASLSNYGSNQDDVTTKINEIKADKAEVKPGEQGKDSVNIVLVMDLSYSMKDDDTDDDKTRLAVAKEAMTAFINKIYYNAEEQKPTNSKATVSVITFNTPEPMGNWSYWTQSYSNDIVANSGVNVLGSANKDNYSQLVTKINNLSLPNENPRRDNYNGMGTYMYGGLEQAETTLANTSAADKKNVVIFLSDGDPTSSSHSGYGLNTNSNIIAKANDIKYDEEGNLVTDFYSIGFGKDASNTESVAYSLLSQMSSEGKVYTSNSVNGLVSNFVNILDDIGIKEIESQHGSITMNPANGLLVSEEYPITVTYHDTEIIKITDISDLEDYSFSYDEATKTLTWDVNAWNASVTDENGRTEVTESKNAVIAYYTPRTTAKKLMRTSLPISFLTDINEEKTLEEDEEIKLDKADKEEEEVLLKDENKAEEEILLDKENNDEKENPVDVDANTEKQKEEPIVDDNENGLQVVENEETNKEKDKDIIEDEEKDATVDENNIEETEISNVDSQLNVDTALKDDCSLNIESNLQGNNQNNLTTLE